MANFFDQFDAQPQQTTNSNFFDQFDASPVGYGEDIAKSAGAGLANATAGTLGMVGDIRSGLSAATSALGDKMGVSPDKVQMFKDIMARTPTGAIASLAPTTRQVLDTAPNPIVSPDYQPQTIPGDLVKTGAEFLPTALAGGPESAFAKLLTRVVAPTATSVVAGQLTKDTAAEPWARAAGALIGGVGASKALNSFNEAKALRAATPALADVKSEASNAYDALTSRNVATPISEARLNNLADDITTTLNNKGIRPSNADSIHRAVDEIKTPATAGAADVADLVAARESIKGLLGKADTNKAGAFVALNKIEKEIEQVSPGTMSKIKEADKNWSAMKANEALDKKVARAELRAAGEHSGANVGNRIRQQVTNLLNSNEAKYLSPEVKAELEKIIKGTWTQNGMRYVANLLGGGGGLGALTAGIAGGAAGYQADGLTGAVLGAGLAGLGRGAKILNNRSVVNQAQRTAEFIRRNSPLGKSTPLMLPPPTSTALSALLPALIARPRID